MHFLLPVKEDSSFPLDLTGSDGNNYEGPVC